MEYRRLGRSSLVVSALGLGCMGMSDFYAGHDDRASLRRLHGALNAGITLLETGDVSGMGANEELVGRALSGRRHEVILATKVENVQGPDRSWRGVNGWPEYVRQASDGSLRRLGVDFIDRYDPHRIDPTVAIEETVAAMADLVRPGKVRPTGLSDASPATIRRAHAGDPVPAVQTEYPLWSRGVGASMLRVCEELSMGLVAYYPLGSGFLTGRFRSADDLPPDDDRRTHARFQAEALPQNLRIVATFEERAHRRGCTTAQLALARVLHRGVVPILGTKRVRCLEENAGALAVHLDAEDIARMEAVAAPDAVVGVRYPEGAMRGIEL